MEKLPSYFDNDCFWGFAAAFTNSENILIRPLRRNWNGLNSVKPEIFAIPHPDTQGQANQVGLRDSRFIFGRVLLPSRSVVFLAKQPFRLQSHHIDYSKSGGQEHTEDPSKIPHKATPFG
jgi:hypothetical protein